MLVNRPPHTIEAKLPDDEWRKFSTGLLNQIERSFLLTGQDSHLGMCRRYLHPLKPRIVRVTPPGGLPDFWSSQAASS